jgi:hypothetical protein
VLLFELNQNKIEPPKVGGASKSKIGALFLRLTAEVAYIIGI